MSEDEKPPRWLVVVEGETVYSTSDPAETKTFAEDLAANRPGEAVHVYQHMIAMRAKG